MGQGTIDVIISPFKEKILSKKTFVFFISSQLMNVKVLTISNTTSFSRQKFYLIEDEKTTYVC